MGENFMELFVQDRVQLVGATASYMTYLNQVGTLYITEYLNSNSKRCIEWKPNDITVDSVDSDEVAVQDTDQDSEWAVVNTVQKRSRTLSESLPPDSTSTLRSKLLKIDFSQIRSFKTTKKSKQLYFYDGKGDGICSFLFQHDCNYLLSLLRGMLKTFPSKRDKHLFIIMESETPEAQQLDRSFAELDIFQDNSSWYKLIKNWQERPVESTFEAFAKVTDFVYRSPVQKELDEQEKEYLNRSLTEYESNQTQFEMIAKVPELPERKFYPRGRPLTCDQWKSLHNNDGRIEDVESIKLIIFRGGIAPNLRQEVWKYLLDYYPWESKHLERLKLVEQKRDEYYTMKLQWKTMTKSQEENFSDYRERKNLIEKDVNRTDRTLQFYAGDNNPNLQLLYDILMTYIMYNFDLGYVQGMSDLLSPILHLLRNEEDSFWCFVGFMNKVCSNFDIDQAGMKEQLEKLHALLGFIEPELANYLDKHDSGNMFFCFRWLLVWFKRELNEEDVMRFWEVMWTGLPCQNFHLLVCVAILENEKQILIENDYGFTEILKHVNDLSGKLEMDQILSKAEGIFYQIKEAEHLNDNIRMIVGLPLVVSGHVSTPIEEVDEDFAIAPSTYRRSSTPADDDFYEQHYNNMEHILSN